ncbi:MAG TPA: SCO family protein [Allosphingosinicella sp.]|jgi:protein SCO1/2|nr:SCO family protein [Allosphingosinicella sp.]
MNETRKTRFRTILCLSLGLMVAACSGAAESPPLEGATIGGPFTLTNQDGRPVTERDFAGKYRIVYFGFTHCPDVCPLDLAVIGQALRRFEKSDPAEAARVVPIFVSVDPERDTPAVLKEYVAAFHPRLVGLTGTPRQVAEMVKRYGAYGAKGDPTSGGGYNVNHSRVAELFGPDGKPIALLPYDKGAEAVAAELERWVK